MHQTGTRALPVAQRRARRRQAVIHFLWRRRPAGAQFRAMDVLRRAMSPRWQRRTPTPPRERHHLVAFAAWASGKLDRLFALWRQILDDATTDLLALRSACGRSRTRKPATTKRRNARWTRRGSAIPQLLRPPREGACAGDGLPPARRPRLGGVDEVDRGAVGRQTTPWSSFCWGRSSAKRT
jgi:hypothetical protein